MIVAVFAMFCFCVVATAQCLFPAHVAPNLLYFRVCALFSSHPPLARAAVAHLCAQRKQHPGKRFFSISFYYQKVGNRGTSPKKIFSFQKNCFLLPLLTPGTRAKKIFFSKKCSSYIKIFIFQKILLISGCLLKQ